MSLIENKWNKNSCSYFLQKAASNRSVHSMLYAMVPYKQTQESKRKTCILETQVFQQIDMLHNNINSGDTDSFCFLFYRSLRCKADEVNVYCNCYHIKYIMLHKKSTMISFFIKLKKILPWHKKYWVRTLDISLPSIWNCSEHTLFSCICYNEFLQVNSKIIAGCEKHPPSLSLICLLAGMRKWSLRKEDRTERNID